LFSKITLNLRKYRNNYVPITDFDCIKEKLTNINEFVKENTEKMELNQRELLKIYELMCRIQKQIYIIADEEKAKETDYKKIKLSNNINILKRYIDI